ncbi:unnamed protein product [Adineta steineri]|uniref:Uncharacterized protein n=1 Tax=Adineta steineri TaxID=433720 RepID=A0A815RYH8_9BILA|nr:unnamed protein product [Adineta steineri]CAF1638819.1 unnamed protein product [Adineta steineri]
MCASPCLKTLRNNIESSNNIQQYHNHRIISNNVDISLSWLDKNTCLEDDDDVCETKRILQDIKAAASFHTNSDDLIKSIDTNPEKIVFLVISGIEAANTTTFQTIHALKQIDSIFVYCLEKQIYEPLRMCQSYSKIVDIFNTQDELCSSIKKTLDDLNKQFAAFTLFNQKQKSMRNLTKDSICFLWYQLLKDILWKMPRTDDWKIRMVEKCRDYYRGSAHDLKHIGEFETQYQSSDAAKWYSKDTFLYKLINQALRTEDIDGLYTLRYYIEDLCASLKNKYEQFKQLQIELEMPDLTLYRGLRLDRDQLLKLKMNEGNLISTNGFLSASRSMDVAKFYAGWDVSIQTTTDTTEPVLFIINMDVNENKVIVADITAESLMPDELEVLFDLGSIFQINTIIEDDTQKPSKWTINMTASNDGDKILNDYILFKREELEEFDVNILFGEFLYDMGEYHKAERYFENLLSIEDTVQLRYSLGTIYTLKGEYSKALNYFQSAYDRNREILVSMVSESDDIFDIEGTHNMTTQIARTLVGIANVYFHTDNFDEALSNYTDALEIYKTALPDQNIPHIGICLQNMGLIYEERGFHDDAMNSFLRANEIYSTTLPDNHPGKAGLLLNIGNVYKLQNKNDLALKSYTDALNMLKKIYPIKHLSITECINNIGLVYMSSNQYDDALKFFLECLENLDESVLSITQQTVYADIYANTAAIYEKKGSICDAIRYYEQSLLIHETVIKKDGLTVEYLNSDILDEREKEKHSLADLFAYLENLKEGYPNGHPQIARCLRAIAKTLSNDKKYQDALQYYNQLLEIYNKSHPIEYLNLSECLKDVSLIHLAENNYIPALDYAINSYNILQKVFSSKHPEIKITWLFGPKKWSFVPRKWSLVPKKWSFIPQTKLNFSSEKATSSTNFNSDHIRKKIFYLYYHEDKYQEALNVVISVPVQFEDEELETILGQIYLKLGQFDQSIIHSRNALRLSSSDSNTARCYTQLGHAYISQHDDTNAIVYYEKSLEILRRDISDEDILADVLVNMGTIYMNQNHYDDSLLHYLEALNIKKKTDPENKTLIGTINSCVGKLFLKQNNYDEALEYYLQSLEILKNSESNIEIAKIHEAIGVIYHQNQNLEISLKHLLIGLELYEKFKLTENDSQLENILGIVAKVYYDKQDFRMALIYYKRSLAIADENDSSSLVSLLYNICQTHFQMNNVEYGVRYLQQCIEIQETLVDDENDEDLITYKQILSFTQLLLDAKKRKRKLKYKRMFHKRHYQRRKKKYVLKVPVEYSSLIEQFCEQSESSTNQQN